MYHTQIKFQMGIRRLKYYFLEQKMSRSCPKCISKKDFSSNLIPHLLDSKENKVGSTECDHKMCSIRTAFGMISITITSSMLSRVMGHKLCKQVGTNITIK